MTEVSSLFTGGSFGSSEGVHAARQAAMRKVRSGLCLSSDNSEEYKVFIGIFRIDQTMGISLGTI
jgi:hypothetical protein